MVRYFRTGEINAGSPWLPLGVLYLSTLLREEGYEVFGGHHVTFTADRTLREFPFVDLVVRGGPSGCTRERGSGMSWFPSTRVWENYWKTGFVPVELGMGSYWLKEERGKTLRRIYLNPFYPFRPLPRALGDSYRRKAVSRRLGAPLS